MPISVVTYRCTPSKPLTRRNSSTPPIIDPPAPSPAVSYRRPQIAVYPGKALVTPSYISNAHAPSRRLLLVSFVIASLGRALLRLPMSAWSTSPPAVSRLHIQIVHFPGGAPAAPFYIGNAHATSVHLLRRTSVDASPRAALPLPLTQQHQRRLRSSPTGARSFGASPRGALPRLPASALSRRLQPSLTGCSSWCIS